MYVYMVYVHKLLNYFHVPIQYHARHLIVSDDSFKDSLNIKSTQKKPIFSIKIAD